jgi:ABC-type antimicrobial peptide transport system permease subunit
VVSERLREAHRDVGTFGAVVSPLGDALRGRFRAAFFVLTGAVICVLGIACVNLSNLLLARTNARRQEFAVRVALGARRHQLVQQALIESLLLAFAGSAVGVPLAMWATRALARLQTASVAVVGVSGAIRATHRATSSRVGSSQSRPTSFMTYFASMILGTSYSRPLGPMLPQGC